MNKWKKFFPIELRIAVSYFAIAVLWIYFSDQWAAKISPSSAALTIISTYKGWFYVAVTALLLYYTLHRVFRQKNEVQEKLIESETMFRNISMNQPGIIFQYRVSENIRYFSFISDGARKMLGLSDDISLNEISILDHIHPDDKDSMQAEIVDAMGNNRGWQYEGRFLRDDGLVRYFDSRTHIHRFNDEYIFDGIILDITDRKLAEESMRLAFEEQTMMLEASPMSIAIWDYNGKLEYVNNRFFELTGYRVEDIPNVKRWYARVYPDKHYRREMIKIWRFEISHTILSGNALKNFETKITCANGNIKDVKIFSSIIHNKVFTIINDITESKSVEEEINQHREHLLDLVKERTGELEKSRIAALSLMQDAVIQRERAEKALHESELIHEVLRESEEKHKIIFENSPLAIIYLDKNGILTHANKKVENIIGFPPEVLIGRNIFGDVNAAALFPFLETAFNGNDAIFEGAVNHTTRGEIYLRILINPTNPVNPPSDIILTIEDVTERIKFENELRVARDAAESANKSKSIFLANMSHEIRTPMNAISGYVQLLKRDESLTRRQQEYLTTINRSSEHLLSLINDVLEMSKIEAGRITLNNTLVDLLRMVADIEMMFKIRANEKGIELQINYKSVVPSVIKADAGKIRQVLINLLSNAVKFTESGHITVDIICYEVDELKHKFIIYVTDTGIGIAPEEIDIVFGEFEQTESGRNQMEGTGLGMTISRAFARLMGGEVSIVSSETDKGTTFRFEFIADSASNDQIVKMSERKRNIDRLSKSCNEKRVLIVDDDMNSRDVLMKLLVDVGFTVSVAADGHTSLILFKGVEFDIVILDRRMPGMSGVQLATLMKNIKEIPILMLTASVIDSDSEMSDVEKIDDYLVKPYKNNELLEKIKNLIDIEYTYTEEEDDNITEENNNIDDEKLVGIDNNITAKLLQKVELGDFGGVKEVLSSMPDIYSIFCREILNYVKSYDSDKISALLLRTLKINSEKDGK